MVKPCTILDLGELTEIVENYFGSNESKYLQRIRSDLMGGFPHAVWFLHKDACLCYEPMGHRKYQAHIWSVSRDTRGTELKRFAIETGRWVVDNTDCTSILNFVEPDRLDLRIFMRMIGSKKIGIIPGTDQILYVSTGDMGIKEE